MNTELILYVADQERSRAFYESVLEVPPVLHVPGMTEFKLSDYCKLGLMPEKGIAKILGEQTPHPSIGNGIPRCELYLLVDDPDISITNAIKSGAQPVSPALPRDWGDIAGYCADPDGHIIAFAKKINTVHS